MPRQTWRRNYAGRMGRPPQGEFENKCSKLTTRITKETRNDLEKAAFSSGRSLSQEIEFRLVRSFDHDELFRR